MPELTAEQKQQLADEDTKQQAVSLRWLTANLHRYKPSKEAAQLMANFIRGSRLPWTEESLDTAFEALVQNGLIEEQENFDGRYTTSAKAAPPAAPALPPWGFVLDKKAVRDLSVEELKKHLRSKVYGKQFEQALRTHFRFERET